MFAELIRIVELLRSPQGCPWDREQTHKTLRRYFLEEAYETLEAIDSGDQKNLEEELGDLLIHVAFNGDIARRNGSFDPASILERAIKKLKRRHPNVFTGGHIGSVEEVEAQWEEIKRKETGRTSILKDYPSALPALAAAASIQERAHKAGLTWDMIHTLTSPSLPEGEGETKGEYEAGELLFSIVFNTWRAGVDPESALRAAVERFKERVHRAEKSINKPLDKVDSVSRQRAWQAAEESIANYSEITHEQGRSDGV